MPEDEGSTLRGPVFCSEGDQKKNSTVLRRNPCDASESSRARSRDSHREYIKSRFSTPRADGYARAAEHLRKFHEAMIKEVHYHKLKLGVQLEVALMYTPNDK